MKKRPASLFWIGTLLLVLGGCSPVFAIRAGWAEVKILSRRQPIARLIADPGLPAGRRAKLQLVLSARDFAADELGLDAARSYTTFSQLDSDTLAFVLSAARKDSFEPYTWWFPFTGRVPYKGYFSEASARRAVQDLERQGYDAYIRPTAAFSTLGWFNDPLVSPLLRYDSVSLANTVIHEIFHNTLYVPGHAAFNESLAQFVGARGAIMFFCRTRPDPELCTRSESAWADEQRFGQFLTGLVDELEALYARPDLSSGQKISFREEVFSRARLRFENEVRPGFLLTGYNGFLNTPLNNASLISRVIYYRRLDLFEEVFQLSGGDLPLTIRRIVAAAEAGDDPWLAVESLLPARAAP
ncbi:MAG: aminopeptidase [Gemmatimonadota bacterium]|nr:aminopeptidase [Gemmatimonadota bacterium]